MDEVCNERGVNQSPPRFTRRTDLNLQVRRPDDKLAVFRAEFRFATGPFAGFCEARLSAFHLNVSPANQTIVEGACLHTQPSS